MARSACGGWLVQTNLRSLSGGCGDVLAYMPKALPCERVQSQHRLSDKLCALAKQELDGLEIRG